jgi:hypothetical protein
METNKLTNVKRIEMLREARERIVWNYSDYICWSILMAMENLKNDEFSTNEALKIFPELAKYKPAHLSPEDESIHGWFGHPSEPKNRTRRIEVMDALIEELEKID